jgi:hypothetical protein
MLDAYIIQKILEDKRKREEGNREQPAVYIEEEVIERPKPKEEKKDIIIIQL